MTVRGRLQMQEGYVMWLPAAGAFRNEIASGRFEIFSVDLNQDAVDEVSVITRCYFGRQLNRSSPLVPDW